MSDDVILTADLHIHKWREFAQLKNGVNDRLLDGVGVLRAINDYALKHDIKNVIVAGDLFHKRAVLDVETFNMVFDFFRSSDVNWWLLRGNHDQANKAGTIHSLEPFDVLPKVHVMGRDMAVINNTVFHFFPYQDDASAVMNELKEAQWSAREQTEQVVAVMHHGFKGARVGSSLEYEVREPLDPVDVEKFGFARVFSGHYHTRQHLGANTMYVGAPIEHTRHDRSKRRRGFLTFNTNTMDVRVVPVKAPRFVEVVGHFKAGFKAPVIDEVVSGNFVDLVLEEEDQEYVDAVLKAGARGVNPIVQPSVVLNKSQRRLDVDPTTDPKEVVEKYVDWSIDQEKTKVDPALLKRVGLDLIKEASK